MKILNKKNKIRKKTIEEALEDVLTLADHKSITFEMIVNNMTGRVLPILLIIVGILFCFPIQIPGFSFPFGIALAFLGIRFALRKRMWWPNFIMKKEIHYGTLEKITKYTSKYLKKVQKFVHPRILFLSQNRYFHFINGIWVAILSLLLALPIPVPFTNMIAAFPLLLMGLGLLEDDGAMILLSYVFGVICITFFSLVFAFGIQGLTKLIEIASLFF